MGLVSKAVRATLRHTGIVLLLSSAITVFATAARAGRYSQRQQPQPR